MTDGHTGIPLGIKDLIQQQNSLICYLLEESFKSGIDWSKLKEFEKSITWLADACDFYRDKGLDIDDSKLNYIKHWKEWCLKQNHEQKIVSSQSSPCCKCNNLVSNEKDILSCGQGHIICWRCVMLKISKWPRSPGPYSIKCICKANLKVDSIPNFLCKCCKNIKNPSEFLKLKCKGNFELLCKKCYRASYKNRICKFCNENLSTGTLRKIKERAEFRCLSCLRRDQEIYIKPLKCKNNCIVCKSCQSACGDCCAFCNSDMKKKKNIK